MFAIIAAVVNGAVRLFIGLRFVEFIHVFRQGDANGHHKVESVAKLLSSNKQLGDSCCFGFVFKVLVIWSVRHLLMLKF